MLKVLDYIYENYSEELSLPFVASKFGYTTNYFSTLFNKFTAMNFNDYVNWVRYNKAVILLNDSKNGYTVTEVSNICGFRLKYKFKCILSGSGYFILRQQGRTAGTGTNATHGKIHADVHKVIFRQIKMVLGISQLHRGIRVYGAGEGFFSS